MNTEWMNTPANWQTLHYHPLCEVTDFGAGVDMDAFSASMRANGYDSDEPVVLIYDKDNKQWLILDGRHRHMAAIHAGVVPSFKKFVGKDPMAFVAKKIYRQHLNENQRAMLAATISNLGEGRPKTGSIEPVSQEQAAKTMKVSRSSVKRASKVTKDGTEKVKRAVRQGKVTVSDAAKIINKSAAAQDEMVAKVESGEAKTLAQAAGMVPEAFHDDDGPVERNIGQRRKSGQVRFDFHTADKHWGQVVRWPDQIAKAYQGEKASVEFREIDALLEKLAEVRKLWHKRLIKIDREVA